MEVISRRSFFTGLVAAPAIIKLAPLMKIIVLPKPRFPGSGIFDLHPALLEPGKRLLEYQFNEPMWLKYFATGDKVYFEGKELVVTAIANG
jgi:hypothetical protein